MNSTTPIYCPECEAANKPDAIACTVCSHELAKSANLYSLAAAVETSETTPADQEATARSRRTAPGRKPSQKEPSRTHQHHDDYIAELLDTDRMGRPGRTPESARTLLLIGLLLEISGIVSFVYGVILLGESAFVSVTLIAGAISSILGGALLRAVGGAWWAVERMSSDVEVMLRVASRSPAFQGLFVHSDFALHRRRNRVIEAIHATSTLVLVVLVIVGSVSVVETQRDAIRAQEQAQKTLETNLERAQEAAKEWERMLNESP